MAMQEKLVGPLIFSLGVNGSLILQGKQEQQ
jgi:hypothetical protein